MNKLLTIFFVTLIAFGASAITESLPFKAQVSDSVKTKNNTIKVNPNSGKGDSRKKVRPSTNGTKGSQPRDTTGRRGHYMSSDTATK